MEVKRAKGMPQPLHLPQQRRDATLPLCDPTSRCGHFF